LEESDHADDRVDCDEIPQVTQRRLEEIGGNNFVFNASLYFEPVQ